MIPWLTTDSDFPLPEKADEDGIVAIGGDLSTDRLLAAYSQGIFPWYEDSTPILWWSPDPRMVLFPEKFVISHSLRQILKKKHFNVTFDTAFGQVIDSCGKTERAGQKGTWITTEMKNAYTALHQCGYAHSIEVWQDGMLAGGLYGVAIGRIFCGESMFYRKADASKVAMFNLVENLKKFHFTLIDAQVHTNHLESLGGELIKRAEYLTFIRKNTRYMGTEPSWSNFNEIKFTN